jgi:hypothetical protein
MTAAAEERALQEAEESGEDVVVASWVEDCRDRRRECSVDRVQRVATPDGDVVTRRTHTY